MTSMRVVNGGVRSNSLSIWSENKYFLNPSYIDKQHLVVNGNVVIYDKIICESNILCCKFNESGHLVAVGASDGRITIHDSTTGRLLYCLHDDDSRASLKSNISMETKNPCTSIRFLKTPSPILIATYGSGMVKFWNYKAEYSMRTIKESRCTLSQAIQPAKERVLTVGTNGDIFIYDIESGKNVMHCFKGDQFDKLTGHTLRVFSAVYHPSTQHSFITGGWDDTIMFWDDRSQHAFRKISGPHLCGESLDIDSTSNHIVSGSWRENSPLQIWNFDKGTLVKDVTLSPITKSLYYTAKWVSPEIIACGGSHRNIVNVVSAETNLSLASILNLPYSVTCLDTFKEKTKLKLCFGSQDCLYLTRIEL